MRKLLKRRNAQKWGAIFKEGRTCFPKPEFGNISVIRDQGLLIFKSKEGYGTKNVALVNDASWGE